MIEMNKEKKRQSKDLNRMKYQSEQERIIISEQIRIKKKTIIMFRLTHKEHKRIENKMTVVDKNVNRKRRRKLIKKIRGK